MRLSWHCSILVTIYFIATNRGMRKEIYLLRGHDHESYSSFSTTISAIVNALRDTPQLKGIRYTITESAPPRISVIPFNLKKIASISVYKADDQPVQLLTQHAMCYGAYTVEEALPVSYTKDWPDGQPTPGACLLTLFSRKKSIDQATFIDRWHNSHTPMSLRFHPLWNYNRNVVLDQIKTGSTSWEGIVEEQVRTRQELLNPFKFFGNPLIILPRMLKVYADTKSFIDFGTMETYLANEYVMRS